jgi:hypothetical protein
VTAAYDLARTRRLLLLLSAASKALPGTRGVPLARAVQLTGARSEREVLADVAALARLWVDPSESEQPIDLYVESGAVHLTYPARRVETLIDYCAVADEAATRRTVEPRALFHRDGCWYLAAWNVEKKEEHLFRLDRVAQVELGLRTFGEHKGPPLARYARRHLFFETGAEREVTLRFRGTAARLQKERGGARARENADGSVSVAVRATPGNYLAGVVLGYGGEASVEGPADVADTLRARVEELRDLYGRDRA